MKIVQQRVIGLDHIIPTKLLLHFADFREEMLNTNRRAQVLHMQDEYIKYINQDGYNRN